jgi:hypothetical protein
VSKPREVKPAWILEAGSAFRWGSSRNEHEKAVELYPTREAAEAFIAEVGADKPEMAALLRVEAIELGSGQTHRRLGYGGVGDHGARPGLPLLARLGGRLLGGRLGRWRGLLVGALVPERMLYRGRCDGKLGGDLRAVNYDLRVAAPVLGRRLGLHRFARLRLGWLAVRVAHGSNVVG